MINGLRAIPKAHIWAKARLLSEGVRGTPPDAPATEEDVDVDVNNVDQILSAYAAVERARRQTPIKELGNVIAFDDSGVHAPIIVNPYSRLELNRHGEAVEIKDGDELLVRGRFPDVPKWWREGKLSNGLPVATVLPAMSEGIINLAFNLSCINASSKRGCRYCNLFANPVAKKLTMLPLRTLRGYARYQAEAVTMALESGWKGQITVSGGALAPAQRGESLQRLEVVLDALGEAVGSEAFARLRKVYNHYPPEDLRDLVRYKELGITATCIDLELMDDAYFAAICPGKNDYQPLARWRRAQEAAVEIFGPYTGSMGIVVVGIEPQRGLIAGCRERLQRGVLPLPFVFYSAPGSAYWGFRPPTADWLIETNDAIADVFVEHVGKIIAAQRSTGSATPAAPSLANCLLFDELQRRAAELLG